MACVNFTGFESGNLGEARSVAGTNSFSTSTVRTGTYSLRINPTTSASGSYRLGLNGSDGRPTAEMSKSSLYTNFYFRVATAPSADEEKICEFADTGGSTKAYITLTSGRVFKLYNNAGSLASTGTTALSLNTWYLIQIQTSTGSGSQPYELLINGVSEFSGSANQLTNSHGSIYLGKRDNLNSRSIDVFYDDVYVDDSAFYNGVEVKRMGPTANGGTAQWTAGTGSSNYAEVDEVVPSASDYIKSGTTANHAHYVTLQSTSTVGASGTIKAFKALALVREDASGTSASQLKVKSGGTTNNTSSFNHSTTAVYVGKIEEVDPNTSSAWTTTNLDAVEIGIHEVNAISMRCEFMSGYVAYIPSGSSPQGITGAGLSSSASFGGHTVTRGSVGITASGLASTLTLGAHTISQGAINITGSGIASTATFGASVVTTGLVNVTASGLASTVTFGAQAITRGAVNVTSSGLASSLTFGASVITRGAVNISGSGLASSVSFGTQSLSQLAGPQDITGSGFDNAETFGGATVGRGSINITASGLNSSIVLGSHVVEIGVYNISASGLSSSLSFGNSELDSFYEVLAQAFVGENAFGDSTFGRGAIDISAEGLPSMAIMGEHVVRGPASRRVMVVS